jgi:hypothetical protein
LAKCRNALFLRGEITLKSYWTSVAALAAISLAVSGVFSVVG